MKGKKASLEPLDYLDFEVMGRPLGGHWTYQEGKGLCYPSLTLYFLFGIGDGAPGTVPNQLSFRCPVLLRG